MARDKVTTVEIRRTEYWQIEDAIKNRPDVKKIQAGNSTLYKDADGKNLLLDHNGFYSAAPELIREILKRKP